MAALVDAIGLASGALGIVSFFQSLVPSDEAMGASIKVKIGNPGADDDPSVVSSHSRQTFGNFAAPNACAK